MRASQKSQWHNVIQWTGSQPPSDFEDFFAGPGGLDLGTEVTATVDGDTLYVDWGSAMPPTSVPLGHWVVSQPSWGADVTPGPGTVVSDSEYQGRYAEIL